MVVVGSSECGWASWRTAPHLFTSIAAKAPNSSLYFFRTTLHFSYRLTTGRLWGKIARHHGSNKREISSCQHNLPTRACHQAQISRAIFCCAASTHSGKSDASAPSESHSQRDCATFWRSWIRGIWRKFIKYFLCLRAAHEFNNANDAISQVLVLSDLNHHSQMPQRALPHALGGAYSHGPHPS